MGAPAFERPQMPAIAVLRVGIRATNRQDPQRVRQRRPSVGGGLAALSVGGGLAPTRAISLRVALLGSLI